MSSKTLAAALDRLDELKRHFRAQDSQRAELALSRLARRRFPDAASLIRFHEILLFMRAYPHNPSLLQKTEELLATFHLRVKHLLETGAPDLAQLTASEVSGIAGTTLSVNWGYDIVRSLAASHPTVVEIDWEVFENEPQFVALLKTFLPLFADGAYAEYPVPYRQWLQAVKPGKESDLLWLLRQFEQMPLSPGDRATFYDGIKLYVMWELRNPRSTRTCMRQRTPRIFYHDGPLIKRADVSLDQELEEEAPLPVQSLARPAGEKFLRMARDAMTIRNRELHGFTFGDPEQVLRVEAGRGVDWYVWGLLPVRRLPLFGYHAALLIKNGVPAGYAESLAFFERTEVGFNLFYTFRDGESAWIYTRLLRFLRQYLGLTVFSIDPYQIGFHNQEAIASGAFWFYRKLGFRPVQPALANLVLKEEQKIASRSGYRTPPRLLRQLATGHLLYEASNTSAPGDWDRFHIRRIGLTIQRRLAQQFNGDEGRLRQVSEASVAESLAVDSRTWSAEEQQAFSNLALVLVLLSDLPDWSEAEKQGIIQLVKAKVGADESHYVRLLQSLVRLRESLIAIGSTTLPDKEEQDEN